MPAAGSRRSYAFAGGAFVKMVRGGGRSGGLLYPSEKSRLDFGIHPKKAGLTKSGRLRFCSCKGGV